MPDAFAPPAHEFPERFGALIAEARTVPYDPRPGGRSTGQAAGCGVVAVLATMIGVTVLVFGPWPEAGGVMGLLLFIIVPCAYQAKSALAKTPTPATLRVFERGVALLEEGKAPVSLTFEELSGLGMDNEEQLDASGRPNGRLRTLKLFAGDRVFEVKSRLGPGRGEDAFGIAAGKLLEREVDQTCRALSSGAEVLRGEGFALDGRGLWLASGHGTPLASFSAVGVVEGRVRAWRHGEENPFLDVPAGSKNARTLLGVIARCVQPGSPASPGPRLLGAESAPGMGRRLFGTGTPRSFEVVSRLLFGLSVLGGLALVLIQPRMLLSWLLFAGILAIAGAVTLLLSRRVDVLERGVRRASLLGSTEIAYADFETYTHAISRRIHKGMYTGTGHVVTITAPRVEAARAGPRGGVYRAAGDDAYGARIPASGGKSARVRFSVMVDGTDPDLDRLREEASRAVAERARARLERGVAFPWAGASLAPDGVHYRASKRRGKEDWRVLPYAASRFVLREHELLLFGPADKDPVATLRCDAENFFPGFELFRQLRAEAACAPPPRPGLPSA